MGPPLGASGPRLPAVPGTVLGLDEAGRGSVLGPLVLGGFLARDAELEGLRALGVRDSKLLTPGAREEVYSRLARVGQRVALVIPAPRVDAAVRHHRLNELEAEGFAELVRRSRPSRVFVDACDPVAARFGRRVAHGAHVACRVYASHGADRELPVVGAASIVAKVRRDRSIERLARSLGTDIGSGYPSDGTTVAYLRAALAEGGAERPWIRYAWSTLTRVKPTPPVQTLDGYG
jgi:ribonuclease HII